MSQKMTQKSVRYTLQAEAESHSRTLLKVRDLVDVSDEPEERGGTNEGFAPTELALSSLMACSNVISHKICAKNDIEVLDMKLSIDAEFVRNGVMLQEEIEVPFPEIHLTINIKTTAGDEKLDILKRDLPRYCPIAKIMSHAGSDLRTTWVVERP